MYPSPFGTVGAVLQIGVVIASVALGFLARPVLPSVLVCGCFLAAAWSLIRAPQIYGLMRTDGWRIWKLFAIQLVLSSIISGVIYGIGFGIHRLLQSSA